MADAGPVVEIAGEFPDETTATQAADALNRWFRWILEGNKPPVPEAFEPLGVDTREWAWALGEDVDWELGPHARVAGPEVRISIHTEETHLRVAGLLKALGARRVHLSRE